MSLSDSLMKGFIKYYNTLSKTGYVDKTHVNKLIIGSWINKVLDAEYGIVLNENQYNLLSKLWLCVVGDCLVPYTKYCNDVTVNKLPVSNYIRFTEISPTHRMLEVNNLRTL